MFIPMEQLFLLKKWLQFYRLNIITHIPLFKTDHIQRGFNQSEIIARFISQKFGLKHICLLKKIKKTKKQSQIEKKLRRKNINGVFTNLETAAADSVLLVDDVITTGATVTEAAATLLAGGVKKVFALSLFGAF
jgi:competence protein ComFC